MADLGYTTQGASVFSALAGRVLHTKFNLPSPGTLNELHAWVTGVGGGGGSGSNNITVSIYSDGAGAPAALLATTSSLAVASSTANQHLSQTGFSVALGAADYWVGIAFEQNHGAAYFDAGGTYVGISSGGAWNPPANPYATTNLGDANHKFSVWGVVGAPAAATFVPQIVIL